MVMNSLSMTYVEAKAELIVKGYWQKPALWMKVRNNTYLRWNDVAFGGIGVVEVRHHSTTVAYMLPDGSVYVTTGGIESRTTVTRINSVLNPLGYKLFDKSGILHIKGPDIEGDRRFQDGMRLPIINVNCNN